MDTCRATHLLTNFNNALNCSFVLFIGWERAIRLPHLEFQIVGANEDRITTGKAVDAFGVGHTFRALCLENDQNFIVGLCAIIAGSCAKVHRVHSSAYAAVAFRWIFRSCNRGFCLFYRINHRNHDTPCTGIQHSLDVVMIPFRHAGKRHTSGVCNCTKDCCRLLPVNGGVFYIQSHPVPTKSRNDSGGV